MHQPRPPEPALPLSGSELLERLHVLPGAAGILDRLPDQPPLHAVGGSVRDLLLGRPPRELDLVVEGDLEEIARAVGRPLRTHPRFGTATMAVDGLRVDLARSRRERYPRPGALPEVAPAPLAEDLGRRDFTVNAIAVTLNGSHAGALTAVHDAAEDLAARRLRVLHGASFRDDPTRLLRLVRYGARLGFATEPDTAGMAREALRSAALQTVSGARLGAELRLLIAEPDPVAALIRLQTEGVADALQPGLHLAAPALARRSVELLGDHGRGDQLVLGLALEAVPERRARELLERLGFPAADREVVLAVAAASGLVPLLAAAGWPSEVAAIASRQPPEALAAAGAQGAEAAARQWLERWSGVRSEITGRELLAAGVAPGPAIARGLQAALAARLDGRARDATEELQAALRAVHEG
jgi:tRNA nucleotidyltransferase (CCA-adding enzyme)